MRELGGTGMEGLGSGVGRARKRGPECQKNEWKYGAVEFGDWRETSRKSYRPGV